MSTRLTTCRGWILEATCSVCILSQNGFRIHPKPAEIISEICLQCKFSLIECVFSVFAINKDTFYEALSPLHFPQVWKKLQGLLRHVFLKFAAFFLKRSSWFPHVVLVFCFKMLFELRKFHFRAGFSWTCELNHLMSLSMFLLNQLPPNDKHQVLASCLLISTWTTKGTCRSPYILISRMWLRLWICKSDSASHHHLSVLRSKYLFGYSSKKLRCFARQDVFLFLSTFVI